MSRRVLHSYGAIQCLERLLDVVEDDGFILINDYGQTQVSGDEEFEHQRFSLATFVGLNFPLLKSYFGEHKGCEWVEPIGEKSGIHSRLLAHRPTGAGAAAQAGSPLAPDLSPPDPCPLTPDPSPVRQRFQELFGQAVYDKLQAPITKARECHKVGRFELAANYYRQALELQPRNWVLLNEVAMFLIFGLRDLKAGIDMAKLALGLNPSCSSELWSTLGDGLFEFGRLAEARSAYQRALEVNASDVRARYNLAWVHQREKNFPAALAMIAEAFALDRTGEYRERLVQKQTEILGQLTQKNQQEYLLLINLVSKYAKKAPKKGTQLFSPRVQAVAR